MDMVMNQEVRTPGVQDGEESDLRTEMIGIAGHLEQGLGAGIEEQIEERLGRSHPQRVQLVGQREDDMEVVGVDEIALLKLEPSPACLRLAFRAAPGSAGVVGHGCFVRTALTLIPVPAESSSPATRHRPICLQLLIAEAGPVAFQKLSALAMSDMRNFQQWPIAADHASDNTLHQPPNYSTADTAAAAAPAASFSPPTRKLCINESSNLQPPFPTLRIRSRTVSHRFCPTSHSTK